MALAPATESVVSMQPVQENVLMNGYRLVDLSEPMAGQDAATKDYVDLRKPIITIWVEE